MLANNTKVYYKKSGDADFIEIKGVQEIPEFTQEKEKVETTCLTDAVKRYENGIGDSPEFSFIIRTDVNGVEDFSQFKVFDEASASDEVLDIKIEYPNKILTLEFPAQVAVNLGGGGVNALITYTLNCTLVGEIQKTYA